MSYTNETTYYGLPLPTGSDKSTFTDNNTAFQAVDAALHTAAEGAAQAALDITSLTSRVGDAELNITNLATDLGLEKAKIVNLQNKETLQDGEIADVRKDAEDMICAYNEATATSTHAYSAGDYFIYNDVLYVATDTIGVGDTIVPDTNCATTNVVTQLAANAGAVGVLSNLTTTDKSSAVAAINEVNTAFKDFTDDVIYTRVISREINFTIAAGGSQSPGFTADEITGYTPILAVYESNSVSNELIAVDGCKIPNSSRQFSITLHNFGASDISSGTLQTVVLYRKNRVL